MDRQSDSIQYFYTTMITRMHRYSDLLNHLCIRILFFPHTSVQLQQWIKSMANIFEAVSRYSKKMLTSDLCINLFCTFGVDVEDANVNISHYSIVDPDFLADHLTRTDALRLFNMYEDLKSLVVETFGSYPLPTNANDWYKLLETKLADYLR